MTRCPAACHAIGSRPGPRPGLAADKQLVELGAGLGRPGRLGRSALPANLVSAALLGAARKAGLPPPASLMPERRGTCVPHLHGLQYKRGCGRPGEAWRGRGRRCHYYCSNRLRQLRPGCALAVRGPQGEGVVSVRLSHAGSPSGRATSWPAWRPGVGRTGKRKAQHGPSMGPVCRGPVVMATGERGCAASVNVGPSPPRPAGN